MLKLLSGGLQQLLLIAHHMQNGWFGLVNILVILANTAVMATTSYPMDPSWSNASETVNVAFSIYFAAELVLKVIAMGPRAYIKDRMNQFDALVVAASLLEIAMMLAPGANQSEYWHSSCTSCLVALCQACSHSNLRL